MTDVPMTTEQEAVVRALESAGFYENSMSAFEGDTAPTVFMSRKRGPITRYAEVGPDASVNGMALDAFLLTVKVQ